MTVAEIVVKRNIGSFFHVVFYLVSDTKNINNNDTKQMQMPLKPAWKYGRASA